MFGTTLLLAIRSIRRHMLRSFLTTLGIIIGVGAVVTMVTLGKATTAAVQQSISSLGTNILQVRPGQGFGRGGGPRPPDFKPEDVEAIADQIAGVTAVAPQAQTTATAIYEGANWSTTVTGDAGLFHGAALAAGLGAALDPGRAGGGQGGVHHRQYRAQEPVPQHRGGGQALPHRRDQLRRGRRADDARGRAGSATRTMWC
jgi:hypothetical protein